MENSTVLPKAHTLDQNHLPSIKTVSLVRKYLKTASQSYEGQYWWKRPSNKKKLPNTLCHHGM